MKVPIIPALAALVLSRFSNIDLDQRVVFFPTYSRRCPDDDGWDVPVHGWIFEPEEDSIKRKAFLSVLRKALDLNDEEDEEARTILDRRVRPFIVDNKRLKGVSIRLPASVGDGEDGKEGTCGDGGKIVQLPCRSGKNGHFKATIRISDDELDRNPGEVLYFNAVTKDGDSRIFRGASHLIPPDGVSVISDIDDTIKESNVLEKRKLMRKTFLEEFVPIRGMANLYRRWSDERGAKFHFVSSSPWQLYEELESFLTRCDFPRGTYHLKSIRLKDRTILNLLADPRKAKLSTITSIINSYPRRRFVLVGDSGEQDPEVYGEVARLYPDRIVKILVRNVKGESDSKGEESGEGRLAAALDGVPREKWTLFDSAGSIKDDEVFLDVA